MHELTVGVFENLETTSTMELDQKVAYMQRILRGAALKKNREVLIACRKSAKELAIDEWNLGKLAGLSAEALWNWAKTDTTGYDVHAYLSMDKFIKFDRELWFKLEKCMRRKHRSV